MSGQSQSADYEDASGTSPAPNALVRAHRPTSLPGDPARVTQNVTDAGEAAFTGALGDYVQGYSALGSTDAAAAAFATRTTFDDGWSKALALAGVTAVQLRSE